MNMKKMIGILLCLTFLFNEIIFSQSADNPRSVDELKNPIPPSPNASAMAKYGEWPVGLYTGVPQISIPIYTINESNINLPISLSYHAAGNKIGETSSWVGLGWSLLGGGSITRSINGLPDDLQKGYLEFAKEFVDRNQLFGPIAPTSPAYPNDFDFFIKAVGEGQFDSEVDNYSINILGKSYKLFLDGYGNFKTLPNSNIKITYNDLSTWQGFQEFNVILEDGTKIIFGGGVNFQETTSNKRKRVVSAEYITSWSVKKIILVSGNEINFTYTAATVDHDSYFSETDFIKYPTYFPGYNVVVPEDGITEGKLDPVLERQWTKMMQLSTIETNLLRLDFITESTERLDLKGGYALKEIKVFSKSSNTFIENYQFVYNYSQAVISNELPVIVGIYASEESYYRKRLKLIKIVKNFGLPNVEEWQLEYNNNNLPSRRSFAQDHWGFYNGATSNTSLLPNIYHGINPSLLAGPYDQQSMHRYGFFPSIHPFNNVREPNEEATKAEVLEKITYPTGGFSKFTYEANKMSATRPVFMNETHNAEFKKGSTANVATKVINIPEKTYVKVDLESFVTELTNTPITLKFELFDVSNVLIAKIDLMNNFAQSTKWFNIFFSGDYTIKLTHYYNNSQLLYFNIDDVFAKVDVSFKRETGSENYFKILGGLRIKTIESNDNVNLTTNILIKNYEYSDALEISPINVDKMYSYLQNSSVNYDPPSDIREGLPCLSCFKHEKINRTSSTKYSYGSIKGGTTGYGIVKTKTNNNGYTVSLFSNYPNDLLEMSENFPYPPSFDNEFKRGILLNEETFSVGNFKLKSTTNTYTYSLQNVLGVYKIGKQHAISKYMCNQPFGPDWSPRLMCSYQGASYHLVNGIAQKDQTIETTYDNSGNALSTTTNYFYDNPNNTEATRIETTDSKGVTIKQEKFGPLELTEIQNRVTLSPTNLANIQTMLQKNILQVPILTETRKGTNLINRSLVNYGSFSGNILPNRIDVQNGTSNLTPRLYINNYDSKGNLLEQQKANDIPECFIWGYGGQYPVAKIVGTTWATANAVFSTADLAIINNPATTDAQMRNVLNNLRTSLPNTFVTTYTYKPLIGVTSETDANGKTATYEYDSFNRLKLIRDFNGNILKTFDYKYKQAY